MLTAKDYQAGRSLPSDNANKSSNAKDNDLHLTFLRAKCESQPVTKEAHMPTKSALLDVWEGQMPKSNNHRVEAGVRPQFEDSSM